MRNTNKWNNKTLQLSGLRLQTTSGALPLDPADGLAHHNPNVCLAVFKILFYTGGMVEVGTG